MTEFRSTRRGLLGLGAVGALAFGLGGEAQAAKLATRVRIVIIGAGGGWCDACQSSGPAAGRRVNHSGRSTPRTSLSAGAVSGRGGAETGGLCPQPDHRLAAARCDTD